MQNPRELEQLILSPMEGLTIEHKDWLNLRDEDNKAKLAKAAIALANEGGGIIVFGMREGGNADSRIQSNMRPENIQRYHQDDLNAAINRFAEPALHSELVFATHPETGVEHAFVVVKGGLKVPVMSKSARGTIIAAQRCYVRKPGPRSEEPYTAAEWNGVLERCLHQRRETMLDAIRTIVQGHSTPEAAIVEQDALEDFMQASVSRWETLRNQLPADSSGRVPHGRYEFASEIQFAAPMDSYAALQSAMDEARRIRLTGWGPFVTIHRQPYSPSIVNGAIETWLGYYSDNPVTVDAAHCDYWRATLERKLFLLRGFEEDAADRIAPGTVFDATLPIWRIGEALLFASRLTLVNPSVFDPDPTIRVACRYVGLAGRTLSTIDGRRQFSVSRVARDNEIQLATEATAQQIDDNLVEILHAMLRPLYERFDFFDLPLRLVQEEVEHLRAGRF